MNTNLKLLPSFMVERENNITNSIYFMHIPKCGGTTIDQIFLKLALVLQTFNFKRFRYIDCTKYKIESNSSFLPGFLSGHLDYNFSSNLKNVFTCSIVREPIDRIISHYKFNAYKLNKNPNQYTFLEFLENEKKLNRDNLVTRHFAGLLCKKKIIDENDKKFAIKNTNLFNRVNVFENWDYFVSDILSSFNFPSVFYSKFQETNKSFAFTPTKYDLELIKKYYEHDFDLYDSIKKSLSNDKINKKSYNKKICIVSQHFKTENKLLNEEQIKKLFNIK